KKIEMQIDPPEVSRSTDITRRKLLQLTAGTGAGLLLSKLGVIGEAIAASEASGTVTVFTSAGQRWELPERGVLPLFQKKYPNIAINLRPIPHGEANPKIQVTMNQQREAFDV